MGLHWIWWIAGALAIGAELLTGTFYLLAVGIAILLGGVVAWLGQPVEMQFLAAGGLGVALTIAAHRLRVRRFEPEPDAAFDIGQSVTVQSWKHDGTARVLHRGTLWDAELEGPEVAREGPLYISAMRGSVLVLSDRRPAG